MRLYIDGDVHCGVNGFKVLILMQDGSVTDTDGDIIGKAVEVPPHGTLKDADALLAEIKPDEPRDLEWAATGRTIKEIMRHHIQIAPTIIPAEEEPA